MAELKALSKLKIAGKLHYWRGTIEIDEYELCAICDEIQAEHDKAVAAMNRAAGKWAKADAELRGDTTDMVNHPPHYTGGEIECIDAIKAALTPDEFRGYCKGNALKYVWRERRKGHGEDIRKAAWYLDKIGEVDA